MSNGEQDETREQYELAMKIMEAVLIEAEKLEERNTYPDFRVFRDVIRLPESDHIVMDNTHLFYELDAEDTAIAVDIRVFTEYTAMAMLRKSRDILENFLANVTVIDKKGDRHRISDLVSSDFRLTLLEKLTAHTIFEVISSLTGKIEDVMAEVSDEASLFAQVIFLDEFWGEWKALGIVKFDLEFLGDECERILAQVIDQKRTSLRGSFRGTWRPSIEEIAPNYRYVLPMWKDAKRLYKQNRNRANWREIIKAAHPDLAECEDLISRLSGKLNDLPEEIQAKLSEKGGDSKPSSIALEHAARLCGIEAYSYGVRYLYYNVRKYEKR